ncbi:hypothetical protein [Flavivirga sp. 57AJ16]|uniref:hypothetical protein n=1 Tax=Flavivirga sp. 57AJ16 TaxID=3025307 RepID=UPI0023666883|nr:hypothetical protein [Flavivirga sp. 57AJ16]MDD7886326.1 hypothetical protein [Flavivirga sp. 57AJ16]
MEIKCIDAIGPYKKLGYSISGKFGANKEDSLSTFMEKNEVKPTKQFFGLFCVEQHI